MGISTRCISYATRTFTFYTFKDKSKFSIYTLFAFSFKIFILSILSYLILFPCKFYVPCHLNRKRSSIISLVFNWKCKIYEFCSSLDCSYSVGKVLLTKFLHNSMYSNNNYSFSLVGCMKAKVESNYALQTFNSDHERFFGFNILIHIWLVGLVLQASIYIVFVEFDGYIGSSCLTKAHIDCGCCLQIIWKFFNNKWNC